MFWEQAYRRSSHLPSMPLGFGESRLEAALVFDEVSPRLGQDLFVEVVLVEPTLHQADHLQHLVHVNDDTTRR